MIKKFTPEDFNGCGHYLVRIRKTTITDESEIDNHIANTGLLETLMLKVGYIHNNPLFKDKIEKLICLTSMSDGWTYYGMYTFDDGERQFNAWDSKEKFCDYLNNNKNNYYRLATQEEVVRVVLQQTWRHAKTN